MYGSVKHRASPRFWSCFRTLLVAVQRLAKSNYELLKANEHHPSLQFKKLGRFRSVRVGLHYRALAVESGEDLIWFWIGHHAEYDHLIGRK